MKGDDAINRTGGLQARLMLTIVLGAVVLSVAAGALAFVLGHQRAVRTSISTLSDLAQAVERTVAIGAYAGDAILLREVADGLMRNPLVASVEVPRHAARPWSGCPMARPLKCLTTSSPCMPNAF
ncbi:MAG: hypothetical protein C0607_10385 [Azoarcus sp.]|jgi:hypothetical protein|nr:MAG: hypothetical protein C0607_10385 [Azoarcus sp.]